MNRLAYILIGILLLVTGCGDAQKTSAKVHESISNTPSAEIVFYVPPLVEASRPRFTPTSEWSQNDDRDTIYVVLRGGPKSGSIGIAIDAMVDRVSLEDEVQNIPPKDTIGRSVEWQPQQMAEISSFPLLGGGALLRTLRPSQIATSVASIGRTAKEEVLSLQVTVQLPTGAKVVRMVRLLRSP